MCLEQIISLLTGVGTLATALGTLVLALYTAGLWRETSRQRRAMQKPLLIPSKLPKDIDDSRSVFVGNFEYPRFDSFKNSKIYYLGLKNIGQGSAIRVHVEELLAGGEEISIGMPPSCEIQANETVALVVRLGYNDTVNDLEHTPYQVVISYYDTDKTENILNLNLWFPWVDIEEATPAIVLDSLDYRAKYEANPGPLFRYAESKGHFEIRTIVHNNNERK
jgi:hypothetical protein